MQSNANFGKVFCNVWHTLVVGGMVVPFKRTVTVKQGGTADNKNYSSLAELSAKDFFIFGRNTCDTVNKTMAKPLLLILKTKTIYGGIKNEI